MIRVIAAAIAVTVIAAPDLAGAEGKGKDKDALKASRFGISVDGVDVAKPKGKGLKASGSKQGGGTKSYKLQNAWPKKGY